MAGSMQMMKYLCSAAKEYKILLCTGRGIHFSNALAKKVDKNSPPSKTSSKSEKEELIDAAADVAASMKGIEDEAFLDITSQLSKLDSTAQQNQYMKPTTETQTSPGKAFVMDEKTKSRLESAKQRFVEAVGSDKREQLPTEPTDKASTQQEEKKGHAEVKNVNETQAQLNSFAKGKPLSLLDEALSFSESRRKVVGGGRQERHSRSKARDEKIVDGQTGERPRQTKNRESKMIYPDGSVFRNDPLRNTTALNIFNPGKWTAANEAETVPMLSSWLEEEDLKIRRTQMFPSNGFEEMARLTEQGKLWKYPIDNEQGMEEELNTPFYEHVFLDKHLAPFPTSGPVRRFMELVILGLSKNPHLSVKEKVAHIKWFEEYFKEKQSLVTAEKLLADSAV